MSTSFTRKEARQVIGENDISLQAICQLSGWEFSFRGSVLEMYFSNMSLRKMDRITSTAWMSSSFPIIGTIPDVSTTITGTAVGRYQSFYGSERRSLGISYILMYNVTYIWTDFPLLEIYVVLFFQ